MIRITNPNQAKDIRVCLFTRPNGLATETKLQRGAAIDQMRVFTD